MRRKIRRTHLTGGGYGKARKCTTTDSSSLSSLFSNVSPHLSYRFPHLSRREEEKKREKTAILLSCLEKGTNLTSFPNLVLPPYLRRRFPMGLGFM